MERQTGMIGRRNRSPLWLKRVMGQGRVGESMGDGRTGRKIQKGSKRREVEELVLCTQLQHRSLCLVK